MHYIPIPNAAKTSNKLQNSALNFNLSKPSRSQKRNTSTVVVIEQHSDSERIQNLAQTNIKVEKATSIAWLRVQTNETPNCMNVGSEQTKHYLTYQANQTKVKKQNKNERKKK